MDKVLRSSQMVIFIKGNMPEESQMAMENTIGRMEAIIKDYSKMDYEKDMGCGKKGWVIVINMRVNIYKIRNMVMESLAGQVVMSIRETINKIFEQGLEKCIGLTEHVIKGNG